MLMKFLRYTITFLLVVTVVAVVGWALLSTFTLLRSLDSSLAGTVITAIAGIIGLLYTQWQAKSREIAEGHRSNKIDVYNTFFEIVDSFMASAKANGNEQIQSDDISPELKKQFATLNRGLIIWASPAVIRSWLKFREASAQSPSSIMLAVDDMMQAIRKDLGNSHFGLKRGDVVKNYLSDPSELDRVT